VVLKGIVSKKITLLLGVALLVLFAMPLKAYSAATAENSEAVKAAYVFNFSKLVDWPANVFTGPDDALRFCVFGKGSDFFRQLSGFVGQTVNNREIEVKRYYKVQYASRCNVIYVSRSEYRVLGNLLDTVRKQPILTISDIPEFIALGGMLELRQQGSKVQFLANRQCVTRAKLTISSELLALALNRMEAMELECR